MTDRTDILDPRNTTARWTRRRTLGVLGLALVAVAVPVRSDARVGGGHSFSSGRSSGGGSRSSGGSSGGGEADLIFLLIRLCIYYPEIGIPLLCIVIGWMWWDRAGREMVSGSSDHVIDGHGDQAVRHGLTRRAAPATGLEQLSELDPAFSEPVLYDYLQLVYRRAWAGVGSEDGAALAPFLAEPARQQLIQTAGAGARVEDVVVASIKVDRFRAGSASHTLQATICSSQTRIRGSQRERIYLEESWTLQRSIGARSLSPEDTRRLGCPSCGAAVQCDPMGRCTNCGTPITEGQLQWQVVDTAVRVTRPLGSPDVYPYDGRPDPSVDAPSVVDPSLPVRLRAFSGRHPDFDSKNWEHRIHHTFLTLQEAWSAGRWDDARPFVTDATWNTLRFWLDQYARAGMRNRLEDVRILKMQLVKVSIDAWYEAVTVRFWAEMKDWVEDTTSGKVLGGHHKHVKQFSEYWTFIRAVGSGGASGDPEQCPSCGAPLDNINAAGTCGYCDSVITTGQFDWVLSRIDQVEVYRG